MKRFVSKSWLASERSTFHWTILYSNLKNVLNHNPKYWQIIAFYGLCINGGINSAINGGNNAASCVWQGVISQTLHSSQTVVWKK